VSVIRDTWGVCLAPMSLPKRVSYRSMTDSTGQSDRVAQMGEIYQALGRFTVEFSRMVHAMESTLIMGAGGNQDVLNAIIIEMTGHPLMNAWRSALLDAGDLSDNDRPVLKELVKEVDKMINLRNDWVHGSWYVGYGNDTTTDWGEAFVARYKNSATGVASPSKLKIRPRAAYIEKAAVHASVLADAIMNFSIAFWRQRVQSVHITEYASDRVRFVSENGHRQIQVTKDRASWQSSEWPPRETASDPAQEEGLGV
jgi:hypothetical protein